MGTLQGEVHDISSGVELKRFMCLEYDDYVAKRMEKDKENMDLVVQGVLVQNVFKNMNNCNFVTLVVIVDFLTETIKKVLNLLRFRRSFFIFNVFLFVGVFVLFRFLLLWWEYL